MPRQSRHSIGTALCLGAIVAGTLATSAHAVPVYYQVSPGVWRQIESTKWPKKDPAKARHVRTANGRGINIFFQDEIQNTNIGFDQPGASGEGNLTIGKQRQQRVIDVLTYMGSLLDEPGSLEVEFNVSENGSGQFLAFAGPLYATGAPHFDPGSAFKHITTGEDPFDGSPDINGTVDFGFNWNSTLNAPANNQYDLATVLLHELTHGLGILSIANPNGSSQVGNRVYSTYDNFLFTGNGKDLFVPTNGATFAGVAADLLGQDNGVFFNGAQTVNILGQAAPVFAPAQFLAGSSISHWNMDSFADPKPLMIHVVNQGVAKRDYHTFELAVLRDLGYNVPLGNLGSVPAQKGLTLLVLGLSLLALSVFTLRRRVRA